MEALLVQLFVVWCQRGAFLLQQMEISERIVILETGALPKGHSKARAMCFGYFLFKMIVIKRGSRKESVSYAE